MQDYETEYEVEIDDATSAVLTAVASADDDALSLVKIAKVDPDEFRKFLRQSAYDDNPDAVELLKAAELVRARTRNWDSLASSATHGPVGEEMYVNSRARESSVAASSRTMSVLANELLIAASPRFERRWARSWLFQLSAVLAVLVLGIFVTRSYFMRRALTAAVNNLDAQVEQAPDLFNAPSSFLQMEFLARSSDREARHELLSTLYERRTDLPQIALERAALLAFASEDYRQASAFVDTGLRKFSNDERLLAARGLVEYEQSSYQKALASFQQAAAPNTGSNGSFEAALEGNEGLTHWALGQTPEAEASLKQSVAVQAGNEQNVYLLITNADLYADYGQANKADQMNNEALRLVNSGVQNRRTSVNLGSILRQRASISFFRGLTNQAKEDINKAIERHDENSSPLDLAQDKSVWADIQEQTGHYSDAVATREAIAKLYERTKYLKGQGNNQLREAHVLLELDEYGKAADLIKLADGAFAEINYDRGLAEAEIETGLLVLRTKQDVAKAMEPFQNAFTTFEKIGYLRGMADAEDKLAVSLAYYRDEFSDEDFSSAVRKENDAIEKYEQIGDRRGLSLAYGNLGIILALHADYLQRTDRLKNLDEYLQAIDSLKKALQICEEITFKLGVAKQYLWLGRLNHALGLASEKPVQVRRKYLRDAQQYLVKAKDEFSRLEAAPKTGQQIDAELEEISKQLKLK